jgi:pyruvate/2-oxoglutarate/acetoin dehydrogenase E1 component/TPP-dependent pyruvate/acetoin dehydrogenase alpha subunit
MPDPVAVQSRPGVGARLGAFVLERYPFAAAAAAVAVAKLSGGGTASTARLRAELPAALRRALQQPPADLPECTPAVPSAARWRAAVDELIEACEGFLHRAEIRASLTPAERLEILRGMTLTRATDNRLKALFTGSDVRYKDVTFQGKGFRSLGQEAIYAAAIRLRRGDTYRSPDGWRGDVIAPLIRDLGAELAMSPSPERTAEMIHMVLSAQMGKAGPPMDGRDLHVGDFARGILPAAAPLATGALTLAGMAMGFAQQRSGRVAIPLMGEGGTSLGEWHEAINICAVRKLPIVFCVQNNQTALSTPVPDQSAARVFADKAAGYGIPGITIDGTDPDEIAAAFAWAVERARDGKGPTLIELVAMRMCGHAHHDDMLYLGKDPQPSWSYPPLTDAGYANAALYAYWRERDPLVTYAARLEAEGLMAPGDAERMRQEAEAIVEEQARAVIAAPWPDPASVGERVVDGEPPRTRVEILDPAVRGAIDYDPPLPALEPNAPHDPKGSTFLDAVMTGVGDALRADPRVFVIGEDVGGAYGNAFLLLRPLLKEFGGRILNSTLAEGAVIGACIGAALAGQRPIGEMQFNDFVATGFNQLVNNAAKIRYRWGGAVPMVLRMPWGGLRHAGPYHSQNTEPWFYRTPGLKIVVPSTPVDARAAMAAAIADPDPVLYYEHIALYREPRIKQALGRWAPEPLPLGKAALRRAGGDLAIVSYGAYVHTALSIAQRLAADGIEASVLDLRWLAPLDKAALLTVARHCSRVLIVHEDTRTGGIGESLAAIVQEEAFESLDAPVRVIGALDTPVPYSPPLEEAFLPGEAEIERAARLLVAY